MVKNDMLVHLLKLPPQEASLNTLPEDIIIRRAQPWELSAVRDFAEKEFTRSWADELSVGFARQPVSVFIAIKQGKVIGFAGYECTRRGFFGPTGLTPDARGKGIGKALLIAALHGLREMGYAYGIIGSAENTSYYASAVGAIEIEDSAPGIYANPLRKD